ncbi:MAG: GNAT family N-acetyltransferase [Verrucomicrobia bacterium]|nr:GNAT family N-acetyltransferase [Verrucomicrobiota bacterium]MCH8514337.1 GNAT family N-acetyltransferase [Kiritimatiellia bacterium]
MNPTRPFTIEPAKHSDAAGIIAAHVRSIREVCAKDYSVEQIAVWSGRDFQEYIWREAMDRDDVRVVKSNETIVGFVHCRVVSETEVVVEGFYLTPEAIGQGVGRELLSMIYEALSNRGIEVIRLQSTKTSVGFYRAMGFSTTCESVIEFSGVKLACFEMENRAPFKHASYRLLTGHRKS